VTSPLGPNEPPTRSRPSDTAVPPDDVTDVLLWRAAIDVVAAHPTDPVGRCMNLLCTGQPGACAVAPLAQRALQVARTAAPPRQTPPTGGSAARSGAVRPVGSLRTAVGRAAVTYRQRFTGWFTQPIRDRCAAPAA
jgi:hypothetical protein